MLAALGWGALAASSLILGVLLALIHKWPKRHVGKVLAFGAGALISAVCFELAFEGSKAGGLQLTAVGLAAGALIYYASDRTIAHRFAASDGGPDQTASNNGTPLALGAILDGIPEQLVLGMGLATGEDISRGLLAAIFISNLPEVIGSASDMQEAGTSAKRIIVLWLGVAVISTLASVLGYAVASAATGGLRATADGFAAGALLVMMIDSMIPEARETAGRTAGLFTVLGFAAAAWLSATS